VIEPDGMTVAPDPLTREVDVIDLPLLELDAAPGGGLAEIEVRALAVLEQVAERG
jgi:hypothetical protein